MAGKTKVNLEFAMSNNTTQTVSFEVPNGVDGKDGKFDVSSGTISGGVIFSGDVTFSKNAIKSTKRTHALPNKSGTLVQVGDYGLGNVPSSLREDTLLGNEFNRSDLVYTDGLFNYWYGVTVAWDGGDKTKAKMQILTGINNEDLYFRHANNAKDAPLSFGRSYKVYSEKNTTTDPQGFIKKASPIININPDGTFTTNDESEGATVTRVAQGEYLIEGVLGFNSDAGWGGVDGGIEIPLDVNKQPLVWVNYEVNKDGSILVKTYHRTHPNAPEFANNDIDGFNDGDPIDIPDGRFISVRVQMPEQSIYNMKMREMEDAQKAEGGK